MLVILTCGSVLANQPDEIVAAATSRHGNDFLDSWSFTETRTSNDGVRIAHYHPNKYPETGWKLISVNGETPDEDTITAFQEEKARRKAEREENPEENGLYEMITPGSLELIEETADAWRFSFQPQDDEDEEMMQYVAGELLINKNEPFVDQMTLRSREPFKPQTGVKVNEFLMEMNFDQVPGEGPVVPVVMQSKINAKAFLVKTIDENVVVEFSDYQPAD